MKVLYSTLGKVAFHVNCAVFSGKGAVFSRRCSFITTLKKRDANHWEKGDHSGDLCRHTRVQVTEHFSTMF